MPDMVYFKSMIIKRKGGNLSLLSVSCNLLAILPNFSKLGKHFLCLVSALD